MCVEILRRWENKDTLYGVSIGTAEMGKVAGQQMGRLRLYGSQQYRTVLLWELNRPNNRTVQWRYNNNSDSLK